MARARNLTMALATAAALTACGAGESKETMPPRHLSANEHQREALRHDREARLGDGARKATAEGSAGAGQDYGCYDKAVPDPETGGERMPVLRPCWTAGTSGDSDEERSAADHRRLASRHRTMAAALWRAEQKACAGLPESEISQSPFIHREDVVRVEPLRAGQRAAGARVVFRAVRGLDATWMRRSVACHQARAAALGYPPQVMSYCPLMAAPTTASVEQRGGEITVTIRTERDEDGAAVLSRARALLAR
ncbi:MAG TPA: hypothetical protein VNO33_16250 [Kofleriaceae bacterium]|nr:hypothetical protein [Kofleriaceae bacterium]